MSLLKEAVQFALTKIKKNNFILTKEQEESVLAVFSGQDTVVCLPTGHGKSVIFEVIPWCHQFVDKVHFEYIVLIISPLLSLMDKQVQDPKQRDLKALRLSSDLSSEALVSVKETIITYLFTSPEILQEMKWRRMFMNVLYQTRLKAVFIDEAHCVEMWGGGQHPFRQSYKHLCDLRSFLPHAVPFCALTATASNETRNFMITSLGLTDVTTISLSPNRSNIMYHTRRGTGDVAIDFDWIVEEIAVLGVCTPKKIIYCQSIEACAKLYCHFDITLQDKGYVDADCRVKDCIFAMFHAKISDEHKATILQSFSNVQGICRVLFATVAFGMGVNNPDIRMVIHYGPSHSTEEYIQECGRGGRDGSPCHAVLYTYSGCTRGLISAEMKDYCKDSSNCRRKHFSSFPGAYTLPSILHECCDVCQRKCLCLCTCNNCTCGKEKLCNNCCQCPKQCTYVPMLPPPTHITIPISEFEESFEEDSIQSATNILTDIENIQLCEDDACTKID